jgi:NADH:ubiquinone oxidoreductase subunit E
MTILVCIGSACHKRGSYAILKKLKKMATEKGVADQLSIQPTFCLGQCKNGVTVKIDEQLFLGISESNCSDLITDHVLPKLKG